MAVKTFRMPDLAGTNYKIWPTTMVVTYIPHTITCDTSNSGTIAATSDTAGSRAISYTVLSSIAVQVFKNNWYVTRTKFGSIDGEATCK